MATGPSRSLLFHGVTCDVGVFLSAAGAEARYASLPVLKGSERYPRTVNLPGGKVVPNLTDSTPEIGGHLLICDFQVAQHLIRRTEAKVR